MNDKLFINVILLEEEEEEEVSSEVEEEGEGFQEEMESVQGEITGKWNKLSRK